MVTKMKNAGDYDLISIGIVKDNEFIDISQIFFDITLYESIFDPSISGVVTVVDTNDIRNAYDLVGGEQFILQYATAGNEEETTVRGIVYKYSPSEKAGNNTAFSIHFYSRELDNSLKTLCVEGYNETISNIVNKIFEKVKEDKDLFVEQTAGITNYVCTRTRPLETIISLASKSVSKQNNSGYVFYEDSSQWNFCTLQYLYQQDAVAQYFYKPPTAFNDVKERNAESFQAIQDIEILNENSYFNELVDGQMGTVEAYYNFIDKKLYSETYSRKKGFNRFKSLGKELVQDFGDQTPTDYNFRTGDDYAIENAGYKNKFIILGADTFSANISVFGDNNLVVGSCVDVTLPPKVSNSESENIYNGKFLVSAIKHVLNKKTYTQVITINKESKS